MAFTDSGTLSEFSGAFAKTQASVASWAPKALALSRMLREFGSGKTPFSPKATSVVETALESVKLPTEGGETGALLRWAKSRSGGVGTSAPPVYRVEAARKKSGAPAKEVLAEIREAARLLSDLWSYVDEVGDSATVMLAKSAPDEALVAREAYAFLDGLLGYYTTLRAAYVLVRGLPQGKTAGPVREHSPALRQLAEAAGIHLID